MSGGAGSGAGGDGSTVAVGSVGESPRVDSGSRSETFAGGSGRTGERMGDTFATYLDAFTPPDDLKHYAVITREDLEGIRKSADTRLGRTFDTQTNVTIHGLYLPRNVHHRHNMAFGGGSAATRATSSLVDIPQTLSNIDTSVIKFYQDYVLPTGQRSRSAAEDHETRVVATRLAVIENHRIAMMILLSNQVQKIAASSASASEKVTLYQYTQNVAAAFSRNEALINPTETVLGAVARGVTGKKRPADAEEISLQTRLWLISFQDKVQLLIDKTTPDQMEERTRLHGQLAGKICYLISSCNRILYGLAYLHNVTDFDETSCAVATACEFGLRDDEIEAQYKTFLSCADSKNYLACILSKERRRAYDTYLTSATSKRGDHEAMAFEEFKRASPEVYFQELEAFRQFRDLFHYGTGRQVFEHKKLQAKAVKTHEELALEKKLGDIIDLKLQHRAFGTLTHIRPFQFLDSSGKRKFLKPVIQDGVVTAWTQPEGTTPAFKFGQSIATTEFENMQDYGEKVAAIRDFLAELVVHAADWLDFDAAYKHFGGAVGITIGAVADAATTEELKECFLAALPVVADLSKQITSVVKETIGYQGRFNFKQVAWMRRELGLFLAANSAVDLSRLARDLDEFQRLISRLQALTTARTISDSLDRGIAATESAVRGAARTAKAKSRPYIIPPPALEGLKGMANTVRHIADVQDARRIEAGGLAAVEIQKTMATTRAEVLPLDRFGGALRGVAQRSIQEGAGYRPGVDVPGASEDGKDCIAKLLQRGVDPAYLPSVALAIKGAVNHSVEKFGRMMLPASAALPSPHPGAASTSLALSGGSRSGHLAVAEVGDSDSEGGGSDFEYDPDGEYPAHGAFGAGEGYGSEAMGFPQPPSVTVGSFAYSAGLGGGARGDDRYPLGAPYSRGSDDPRGGGAWGGPRSGR